MEHSKLRDHQFRKGLFIAPVNTIPVMRELSDDKTWVYGRMPEYIWIVLIMKYYGREEGFKKIFVIINALHRIAPSLKTPRLSQIIRLTEEQQRELYEEIVSVIPPQVLCPLTIFMTLSRAPVFATWFYDPELKPEERCDLLVDAMNDVMNQHSNESTDVRYIALCFTMLSGQVHLLDKDIDLYTKYPKLQHSDEIMRMIRPSVRATEMMIYSMEQEDLDYLELFWESLSEMTDCSLFGIEIKKESRDISIYMERLHEVFAYMTELYKAAAPIDEKTCVLLGIATYSYKRFYEVYSHGLFNTIIGRSCVRVLVENFIMIKYLVKHESEHDNIWKEYEMYGIGQYKLVLQRFRENEANDCDVHFVPEFIEAIVNEFTGEEFLNMDTRYFDKQNIRGKAIDVDEKLLFDLYYDYDSAFEHGLWGAIRESSLLKCNNPAHKYHCVPDIDNTKLMKSVLPDCIMVMNKTLMFLDQIIGVPEKLLDEVIEFEIKSDNE